MDKDVRHTHSHTTHTHTVAYYSVTKKGNSAICDNIDGAWGHYAK